MFGELADRNRIAVKGTDDIDIIIKIVISGFDMDALIWQFNPFRIDFDFAKSLGAGINRAIVHIDDILAFFAIGLQDELFHPGDSLFIRHYRLIEIKEAGLENRVGMASQTDFAGDLIGIDDIELGVFLR